MGDDADCEATPIPLAAHRPRSEQRFTIAGEPGVWVRTRDLTGETPGNDAHDVTAPRTADSVLATLGGRLWEFVRDRSGSEL